MELTDDKYMALAEMYFWAGTGKKVKGLIHNLNNHVHVADMYLSMLASRSASSGDQPLAGFKDKLSRAAGATARIVGSLQENGQLTFFSQKNQALINIRDYLEWLLEFWKNDLFFKHEISCELIFENHDINLRVIPYYLTLCLEQGIGNAVEAYQETGLTNKHKLLIYVVSEKKRLDLTVKSFTQVPDLNPWLEGSSSKPGHLGMGLPLSAYLAESMGWHIDLQGGRSETNLLISVPG